MTYSAAIDYLYSLQKFGARLGLETTRRLAEMAGNPHDRLRFIHVAGTNGKGSTCAMLEAIYRQSGYRVGLFTSPHLISFTERFQINRQPVSEPELACLAAEVRDDIQKIGSATLFEASTIMALRWFEREKVDLVVWETGLGGRLDSTNIVTPLASVITNIQLDHEKWLGHTLAEIAREKAGIIKPGVPLFTTIESPQALAVVQAAAAGCQAPIRVVTDFDSNPNLPLLGSHQRKNAALALAVASDLQPTLPLTNPPGPNLSAVQWPGRFDLRGRFILDGAHNPAGAASLRETLQENFPGLKPAFIIGILADKDIPGMAREIVPVASRVLTVSVASDRGADSQSLACAFQAIAPDLSVEPCPTLADAIDKTGPDDRVVITGSLHFIGEAMQQLGFLAGSSNEQKLNDWTGRSGI